jgi:hypothetical protein
LEREKNRHSPPPYLSEKRERGGVCLNNRNNREFGNEKRKRESRGILPSGQRAAVYPPLVDLSSYR